MLYRMMEAFDALVRTETELWNLVESDLRDAGAAGLGTLQSLRVLHRREGRGRVRDLCDELAITTGAASKLTDRLEGAGLIARAPHPEDRRSSLLQLTPEGEDVRVTGEERARALIGQVIEPEDAASLEAVLERIRTRISEAEPAS
ncbi:MarR family transcriptional regulator [Brachybacterium ginsengisoli]|uniref:MarR family transcriptional regulator n=2 Tax=Brachybacterium ginsengisoli TaxID=1331682 RepID=A0A291GV61_9MICO|nr:MarR family transcriptional regulator [Brachybacterium ginsengisoli]